MEQLPLQIMLITASILTLAYITHKVKKSKMQIDDTVFWIVFSFAILIIAIFPSIIFFFSSLLVIESPTNLLYLIIIFILIVNQFRMTQKLSETKNTMKTIIQLRAIENNEKEQKEKNQNC